MAQVITTILLDDNPKGLRLIEMANWSGKAFVVPRGKLKEFKAREDAQQPGLYFLFGEGDERSTAYIGQSENLVDRLYSHDMTRKDDEWNAALVFVGNLDSTFIRYLESVSIDLAKKADRYDIFNNAAPKENKLSEAQKIVASDYFERIRLIVGLLGYSLFEGLKEQQEGGKVYVCDLAGVKARGMLLESQEFVVYKDSTARLQETKSFNASGRGLRKKLIEQGVLKPLDDKFYVFSRDYVFATPSAAGGAVTGSMVNGWRLWKDDQGKTLDENVKR